ncbi:MULTISPECIES: GNAT family N-acetyltransferase [Streptomyces]|uniref:GNAT family acetyltransferase n=1 Tax=Streptomyces clavifer TaxID=68188 RepID=A0ABS4V870_9ACTN|nr:MULTISPECIES: GNAT family N-acetyltransferase [Streptomyces]KQX83854.1 acetyltransferase [Streptomyces sp. Root1319]KQZ04601.1 acetyltransferase [Streptomyces sp. Root55]MBP2359996.1 putative GNAT family acetyltransferase [Streptomyces clavifer]MDX2747815.1 GNAT family N-acetyltransferase [Streptomyces sp. NRRL_B-2557]MDX3062627.1 GNAT family N-acetyltransferase [Streptomyces sp. ND04-05B]
MRPDDWYLTEDVDDFLDRAGDFLRSRPGPHVMQLTWAERIRARGVEPSGTDAPLFGVLERAGRAHATFYRLPSRGLGLSPLTPEQADSLAARLAALGQPVPSAGADHGSAGAFAEAWQRHTGVTPELRDVRLRLYRLGTLTPPEPLPAGRGRVLGEQDLEQVIFWCGEFAKAVGDDSTIDAATWSGTRFADKRYTLWETPDGTPVSVAGMNPLIGGQIQVDIVYTPAHLRGHGYAGAVTAEVSRAALAAGAKDVVLFADLSNPTSNALYQRLGYRTLTDWAVYDLSGAAPEAG